MKPGIPLLSLLAVVPFVVPRAALAAEGPRDRETDHLDAFDDGGPRSLGVLVNPAGVLLGVFGVEADVLLTDLAALSVEGDWFSLGGTSAYGATAGVALFPQQVAFHGLYLHPQLSLMRATDGSASASLLGGGATLGWEWTLRVGLTLRAGGGAMFAHVLQSEGSASFALDGLRPMADGSVGWVF
jgi:hypothetical protein